MTKSEFISFLTEKQEERGINLPHWRKTYDNHDDWWHLYKPFVDWAEDEMLLRFEGCVIVTTNISLYGNDRIKTEYTYEDFIKNYDKSLG